MAASYTFLIKKIQKEYRIVFKKPTSEHLEAQIDPL